ncbi:alkyl sulfatase dimerization domain-containing protein [Streptomyces sp. NPDC051453]|uniref:alkyl sulfatase dimerization domain-containing protein n=1 Tax=Streptomyces sp. NPDC051453 TaxID=3154941 RepID=UPI0034162572
MTDSTNPLHKTPRADVIEDGVYLLPHQGNGLAVETPEGLLVVDTGPAPELVPDILAALRTHTDAPVRWIVYSHGHQGYNAGVPAWLADAERRGDPRPEIVAHDNVVRRYRRYQETAGLQNRLNAMQFRRDPASLPAEPRLTMPDRTYDTALTLTPGVRLLHAPSETDDVTAVWLPERGILYGSAAVIESIPNIGTPLRTLRDPVRWADTLDRLAALRPRIVVPEFGPLRRGDSLNSLTATASALRWLRRATVERLNRGMTVEQILHDITYPPELFDVPWMTASYGHPDFIVRDIVRSETGWWDENPTSLHPADPDAAAVLRAAAITDKRTVVEQAAKLRDEGRAQEALHVIDLLATAHGDDPWIVKSRALKASLCRTLAENAESYVSRSLYLASATALGAPSPNSATASP